MMPSDSERIAANDREGGPILALAAVVCFWGAGTWYLGRYAQAAEELYYRVGMIVFHGLCGLAALECGKNLACRVYFTYAGLEFCRFGKCRRTLLWKEVAQVGIGRLHKGRDRIWIAPAGARLYDTSQMHSLLIGDYLAAHWAELHSIDLTAQNLALIRRYYGEPDYEQ